MGRIVARLLEVRLAAVFVEAPTALHALPAFVDHLVLRTPWRIACLQASATPVCTATGIPSSRAVEVMASISTPSRPRCGGYTRRRSATSAARHSRTTSGCRCSSAPERALLVGGIGELVRRKVLDQGTEDEGRGRGPRSTDAAPGGGTASAPVCGSAGASRDWRGRGRRGHTHPTPLYRLISGRSARDDRDSSGGGDPAVVLVDGARDVGADLLILGRRGGDFVTRTVLGSVAQRVVEQAPCDALVLG